ncbi:hypothetical protein FALBO_4994 [Fusarium albosuccineum]|uniref:BZIP domain-containing protein n=1 Tax=Fusarium albosuccineum TaxID=1237068 RepID=A0A8H4PA82_9HYPO|nr:hypothetical protein FALBO_4994 [Fusarium albosuccineum]
MSEKWQPYILGAEDDWSEVRDSGQRKRIQNRLAQRARRASLKAKRHNTGENVENQGLVGLSASTSRTGDGTTLNMDAGVFPGSLTLVDQEIDLMATTSSITNSPQDSLSRPQIDPEFLFLTSLTTIAALSSNATLLQISCEVPTISTFNPPDASVPSPLKPTNLQKTVPHPSFVDVIPFPGVRNRILRSLAVIDLEKFTTDLTEGAFKVWGSTPWDGTSWEVSEAFAKRWWFLVDEQLLSATNFWRRQRLEPAIAASDILLQA